MVSKNNFFLVKQKQLWNKGYGLGLGHFAPRPRQYRDREFFLVLPPWILGIMPDDVVKMTRDERCYLDFSAEIFFIPMQGSWSMRVGFYLHALSLGLGKKLWQPLILFCQYFISLACFGLFWDTWRTQHHDICALFSCNPWSDSFPDKNISVQDFFSTYGIVPCHIIPHHTYDTIWFGIVWYNSIEWQKISTQTANQL